MVAKISEEERTRGESRYHFHEEIPNSCQGKERIDYKCLDPSFCSMSVLSARDDSSGVVGCCTDIANSVRDVPSDVDRVHSPLRDFVTDSSSGVVG